MISFIKNILNIPPKHVPKKFKKQFYDIAYGRDSHGYYAPKKQQIARLLDTIHDSCEPGRRAEHFIETVANILYCGPGDDFMHRYRSQEFIADLILPHLPTEFQDQLIQKLYSSVYHSYRGVYFELPFYQTFFENMSADRRLSYVEKLGFESVFLCGLDPHDEFDLRNKKGEGIFKVGYGHLKIRHSIQKFIAQAGDYDRLDQITDLDNPNSYISVLMDHAADKDFLVRFNCLLHDLPPDYVLGLLRQDYKGKPLAFQFAKNPTFHLELRRAGSFCAATESDLVLDILEIKAPLSEEEIEKNIQPKTLALEIAENNESALLKDFWQHFLEGYTEQELKGFLDRNPELKMYFIENYMPSELLMMNDNFLSHYPVTQNSAEALMIDCIGQLPQFLPSLTVFMAKQSDDLVSAVLWLKMNSLSEAKEFIDITFAKMQESMVPGH